MQYWILKGRWNSPSFANDFERMIRRGSVQHWFSSKLLDEIHADDRLFVYAGAPKFEIWGLARYVRRRRDGRSFLVEYQTDALAHRVQRDRDGIADNTLFHGARFLKPGPVQTIYLIDEEQAAWLYAAVTKKEPTVDGTWPDLENGIRKIRSQAFQPEQRGMRALSIRQPWAELIMLGRKKIEYRSWFTHIRGRVYVYAGLGRYPQKEEAELSRESKLDLDQLPRGVLVGTVELAGCEEGDNGFEWKLKDPERALQLQRPTKQPQPGFFYPF